MWPKTSDSRLLHGRDKLEILDLEGHKDCALGETMRLDPISLALSEIRAEQKMPKQH